MAQIFDSKLAISFYAVALAGSVSGGARARGVAQPWMSEQMRKLEVQLGCRLFDRSSRRLDLTDEGAQFLPYAKALAEADEAAQRFASGLGRVDEVGFPNQVIADSRLLFEESGVGSQADVG